MKAIDKINYQLKKRGVSGAELCRDLGLSNSIYSQWNTGKVAPSGKSLKRIAEYFGISIEEILDDKEIPVSQKGNEDINKDKILIDWFRSLPPEKQRAILILQGGPEDAL